MELSVSLAIWEFHCLILYIKNQKRGHKISIKLLVYCNKKKTGSVIINNKLLILVTTEHKVTLTEIS